MPTIISTYCNRKIIEKHLKENQKKITNTETNNNKTQTLPAFDSDVLNAVD